MTLDKIRGNDIIDSVNDKRDGDIGKYLNGFLLLLVVTKCKNHLNAGNWGGFYMSYKTT